MYDHRITKEQAKSATRWMVVTFHEELPAVDSVTEAVIITQFVRELSANIQFDVDIDDVVELLESLDRLRNLYWRIEEFASWTGNELDELAEQTTIWDVFEEDLNRALWNYSTRPAHHFQTAA